MYPNKRRISYINFYISFNSAIQWKSSVDEIACLPNGERIPCILVENKVDLLDEEEGEQDINEELKEFAINNEFLGYFRTSAKTGYNISESIEFLIRNIIF